MIDHELLFADGQTLTNAAPGAIVADLEQAENADLSSLPFFAVVCQTDIEGTIQPKLQHSDTKNGTYTDCAVGAIAEAPTAGTTLLVPAPVKTKRFIRAYFDGAPQGKVSAFLTWGRQAWTAVPEKEESGDEGGGGDDGIATLTVGVGNYMGTGIKGFTAEEIPQGEDAPIPKLGSLSPTTVSGIEVKALCALIIPNHQAWRIYATQDVSEDAFQVRLASNPSAADDSEFITALQNASAGDVIQVKIIPD